MTYTTDAPCKNSSSQGIYVYQPPTVDIAFPDDSVCTKADSIQPLLKVGPAGGQYSLLTSNTVFGIDPTTGMVFFNDTVGTFQVIYETLLTDCNARDTTDTVWVLPSPVVQFTYPDTTICPEDSLMPPSLGSALADKYFFSNSSGVVVDSALGSIRALPGATGMFTVEMVPLGCALGSTQDIEIFPLADPSFYYPTPICSNDGLISPIITGNGGGEFFPIGFTPTATNFSSDGRFDPADLSNATDSVKYVVENSIQCPDSFTLEVTAFFPDTATFSFANGVDSFCLNGGSIEILLEVPPSGEIIGTLEIPGLQISSNLNQPSLTPGAQFIWQHAIPGSANPQPQSYPFVYTLETTFTGGICMDTRVGAISLYDTFALAIGLGATTYCSGDSTAQTIVSQGPGGGTFSLAPSSNSGFSIDPATGLVSFNGASGQFVVAYETNFSDCNSTSVSDTITVIDNTPVSIDLTDPSFCQGEGKRLTITGGPSSLPNLTTSDTTVLVSGDSVLATNQALGAYQIYSNSAGACPFLDTLTITVLEQPDAEFSYLQQVFCRNVSVALPQESFNTGGNYGISPNDTCNGCVVDTTGQLNLDTIFAQGFGADTLSVIRTMGGTCPDTHSVTVRVLSSPDAFFEYAADGTKEFCLDTAANLQVVPGSPGLSDANFSASPLGLDIDNSTGTIDMGNSGPGTYTIENTISLIGQCSDVHFLELTLEAPFDPVISLADTNYCGDDDSLYVPDYSGANPNYIVNFQGDSTISGLVNTATGAFQPVLLDTGQHYIYATSSSPCQERDTVSFNLVPLPDAQFELIPPEVCANETSYQITLGSPFPGSFSSPTLTFTNPVTGTINLESAAAVTHSITYTAFNGTCSNSFRNELKVSPVPAVGMRFFPDSVICEDEVLTIRSAFQTGDLFYPGGFATISELGGADFSRPDSSFSVRMVRSNGICSDSINRRITVIKTPEILLENPDTTLTLDEPLEVDVLGIAHMDQGNVTWSLIPISNTAIQDTLRDSVGPFNNNATIQAAGLIANDVLNPGIHRFDIYPWNEVRPGYQCRGDTTSYFIDLLATEGLFFIPEVFTPNGDGQNDVWNILAKEDGDLDRYSVEVFNRAGGRIWQQDNLRQKWEGTGVPDGVYWWLFKNKTTGAVEYTGGLTIISKRPIIR